MAELIDQLFDAPEADSVTDTDFVALLSNTGAVRALKKLKWLNAGPPSPIVFDKTYEVAGHSFQLVAIDLTLGADAGSGDETNPKFLAPIMGNLHGDALAKDSNYLAGVIGGYAVTGTKPGATYPVSPLIGILFDGGQVDGIVMAVLDGDDGGAATNARAFFAVAVNNNNVASGVEYGVDLFDDGNPNYTGGGNTSAPSKAAIRFPNGTWFVTLDTAITANTTTTDAPAGSLGITSHATGAGKLFSSDGSKWQFTAVA